MASQASLLYTERIKPFGNDSVEQASWAEKKWIWIADKEQGYLSAYVIKEQDDKLIVKLSDETTVLFIMKSFKFISRNALLTSILLKK